MTRHDPELARRLFAPGPTALTRQILNGARSLLEQAEALACDPSLAATDYAKSLTKSIEADLQRLRVQLAELEKPPEIHSAGSG